MGNATNYEASYCLVNISSNLITKILNIFRNPKSTCPIWNGFLIALIILIFGNSLSFEFVYYDDYTYTVSKLDKGKFYYPSFLKWAFISTDDGLWAPLTKISHQIDTTLFGENAGWHHAINLILHSINSLLLWKFLVIIGGESLTSFLSTAIFAIHPLRVEPVCWIASRKDLLSTLFLLLMLIEFLKFLRYNKNRHYLLTLFYYCLSALSKPIAMVFPIHLPLLFLLTLIEEKKNFYKISSILIKFLPFIGIILFLIFITMHSEKEAIVPREFLTFPERIFRVIVALSHYLLLTFVPLNLHTPFGIDYYLLSGQKFGEPVYKSTNYILLLGILFLALSLIWILLPQDKKNGLITYLMFLVPLLPIAGFIPFGHHLIADRFTYPAHIALSLWLLNITSQNNKVWKTGYNLFLSLILLIFASSSFHLSTYWQNSEKLFSRTLKFEPNSYVGLCNLASSYLRKERYHEAIPLLQKTIELYPHKAEPYNDLGYAYQRLGRYQESLNYYMKSLQIDPDDAEIMSNISALYFDMNDLDNAKKFAQNALQINPHLENPMKILVLIKEREEKER